MRADVVVLPDAMALADAVAERFVAAADEAIGVRGRFVVALGGGATPRATFERIASAPMIARVDWTRVHVVWGDERCVSPDDPASNFRLARETVLDHVPVRPEHVHRIHGEVDPVVAAAQYEATLRQLFATPTGPPRATSRARIDLALLGLGPDGHTASLFPASEGLHEFVRWVIPAHTDAVPARRITLTPAVLNAAAEVVFVVSGVAKADVLQRVLEGPHRAAELPAQAIAPSNGHLRWYVDAAAASRLAPSTATASPDAAGASNGADGP